MFCIKVFRTKIEADLALEDKKELHKQNLRAFFLSESACVLVVLTGSFSVRETGLIHSSIAVLMFLLASVQMLLFTFSVAEKLRYALRSFQRML